MPDLGELGGEEGAEADFTFSYFGTTIRVHPDLTDVAVVDLFSHVDSAGADVADLIIGTIIHPADVKCFRDLVRTKRQSFKDLARLTRQLPEGMTGRPTSRPSASSDGPPTTPTSSEDDAYSQALDHLAGRPDLQAAVVMAQRELAGAAAG